MYRAIRAATLVGPVVLVLIATLVPMPLRWSIGLLVLALMLFQLALAGAFRRLMPSTRVYVALREETDELLQMVRELNGIAIDARRIGADPRLYTTQLVNRMHETVDRLPDIAGQSIDGELHMTPQAGRELRRPDEIH